MADYRKTSAVIGVVLGMLSLAACAPRPATAAPTIDLNPFRTEVASTVLAQVTQTVCPVPSDTPSPSPTVTAINVAAITPTLIASTTPVLTGTLVTGHRQPGRRSLSWKIEPNGSLNLSWTAACLHPVRLLP